MLRSRKGVRRTIVPSSFLTVVGADFLGELARAVPIVVVVLAHDSGRGAHEAERDRRPVGPTRGARRRDPHRHRRRRRSGRAMHDIICSQKGTSQNLTDKMAMALINL